MDRLRSSRCCCLLARFSRGRVAFHRMPRFIKLYPFSLLVVAAVVAAALVRKKTKESV